MNSEQLFDYAKVEITQEPRLIIIPVGISDYPEHERLVVGFAEASEEYLPASEIQDYTTAELLIPAITQYLQDTDEELAGEIEELGGVIVTQVIQLTGNQPSIIVSVTLSVDDDDEDEDSDDGVAENWE